MKRQRGRGRRSGGGNNNPNKHFESNGPDVKIRGSAQQILDKYQQYARDAQSSGDRVNAENYLQHAEHYYRVLAELKPKPKPGQAPDGEGQKPETTGEDGPQAKSEGEDGLKRENNRGRGRGRQRRDRDEQKPEDEMVDGEEMVSKADASAPEETAKEAPAKTAPSDEADAPVAEEKPKRRRTYKKRTPDPETGEAGEDGVMKTLSRGRKKAPPKADKVEADMPEPADIADASASEG